MMNSTQNISITDKEESAKKTATLVYLLQALGFVFGLTFIAAIIVNYIKLDDAKGTWVESHFHWQIRTFWFSLLWSIIGALTAIILIGFVILFVNMIWVIYRIAKGWLYLNDGKEITQ